MTMTIRIEMELPDDIDPSEVLSDMQQYALEKFEAAADDDCDDDDDDEEGDDGPSDDEIENAVSVEVLPAKKPTLPTHGQVLGPILDIRI